MEPVAVGGRSFAIFRAVLCLSTALMMAISWPLWVTGGEFPRVPWFGWVRLLPAWASWVRYVAALAGMVAASAPWRWESIGLRGLVAALVLSAWMVLEDQFRLQPWMYQFLLMGFALAACPGGRARGLCRVFVIAMYLHSGLSKLDHAFLYEGGEWFLFHGARALGVPQERWHTPATRAIVFAMPCWEIAVATALAFRARRLGIFGAMLVHASLLIILGPRGMNHSLNVLIWNAALLVEIPLLFAVGPVPAGADEAPRRCAKAACGLATGAIVAAAILPLGERAGYWDTWPSFGLYASSNERSYVALHGAKGNFPHPTNGGGKSPTVWETIGVDLRRWSLQERRVPLYPSVRALNGVAEALAGRYRDRGPARVAHDGRADRRTGERARTPLIGLDAIRAYGDTFWLNAHPAR